MTASIFLRLGFLEGLSLKGVAGGNGHRSKFQQKKGKKSTKNVNVQNEKKNGSIGFYVAVHR